MTALPRRPLGRAHGVPLAAAAQQFPLAHPAVGSVASRARSRTEARLVRRPVAPASRQEREAEGMRPAAAPAP